MDRIAKVFTGNRRIDEDLMDDLEEALVLSDVGIDTTEAILGRLKKRATWEAYVDQQELMTMLREEVVGLLAKDDEGTLDASNAYEVPADARPHVISAPSGSSAAQCDAPQDTLSMAVASAI